MIPLYSVSASLPSFPIQYLVCAQELYSANYSLLVRHTSPLEEEETNNLKFKIKNMKEISLIQLFNLSAKNINEINKLHLLGERCKQKFKFVVLVIIIFDPKITISQ